MNCVIDNPMCDGASCANCQLAIRTKERDEAREVARTCWASWKLYADLGSPPGTSLGYRTAEAMAILYPWLKTTDEDG